MKIITVEHLSKYYTIGHDRNSGVIRYKTFRESMMSAGRSLYQRLRHPLSPNREQVELEEFRALDDVSFEVEQGDRIGIIGRNGAGKSTLLKLLCRITEPTKGRITMRGRVASLLEVGTGFHPELSGRENIYLNGAILGMKRAEIKRKFDEIVDFSGVEKFLDTPVKRYSSGMYVRLAFAVAAHLESEILLIDEVLAVGDAEFQKKCLGKMDDISKNEGRTILFVSHNMGAITQICNRGILLKYGTKIIDASTAETIVNYSKELKKSAYCPLSQRKDRTGNQQIKFSSLTFYNAENKKITTCVSGSYIKIKFELLFAQKSFDPNKLIISFSFCDDCSNAILSFISDEIKTCFSNSSSAGFYLEIPELNLRPNQYNISLYLAYETSNVACDRIDSVQSLEVMDNPHFLNVRHARSGISYKARFYN